MLEQQHWIPLSDDDEGSCRYVAVAAYGCGEHQREQHDELTGNVLIHLRALEPICPREEPLNCWRGVSTAYVLRPSDITFRHRESRQKAIEASSVVRVFGFGRNRHESVDNAVPRIMPIE